MIIDVMLVCWLVILIGWLFLGICKSSFGDKIINNMILMIKVVVFIILKIWFFFLGFFSNNNGKFVWLKLLFKGRKMNFLRLDIGEKVEVGLVKKERIIIWIYRRWFGMYGC